MSRPPKARGRGLLRALLATLRARAAARGLPRLTLVAVNASRALWQRLGFRDTPDAALQAAVHAKYGAAAVHMETAAGP